VEISLQNIRHSEPASHRSSAAATASVDGKGPTAAHRFMSIQMLLEDQMTLKFFNKKDFVRQL
jgi:hypothetical protein